MALILIVLLLALLLGGLGFAIHILWWIALIVLVVWCFGFSRSGLGEAHIAKPLVPLVIARPPSPGGLIVAGCVVAGRAVAGCVVAGWGPGADRRTGAGLRPRRGQRLVDAVVQRQPVGQARDPQRLGVAVTRAGQQEHAACIDLDSRQWLTTTARAEVSMKSTADRSRMSRRAGACLGQVVVELLGRSPRRVRRGRPRPRSRRESRVES